MQCVFWERKLVTSNPFQSDMGAMVSVLLQTVSAMFPVIILWL